MQKLSVRVFVILRFNCTRIYIHTYVHICTYVCMYVHMYIRMYVRTYVHTYVCMCMLMSVLNLCCMLFADSLPTCMLPRPPSTWGCCRRQLISSTPMTSWTSRCPSAPRPRGRWNCRVNHLENVREVPVFETSIFYVFVLCSKFT